MNRPEAPVEGEPIPSGMRCGPCGGILLVHKPVWVDGETSIGGLSSMGPRWTFNVKCESCGRTD